MHPDPETDRAGVHKKGDIINIYPDGWSDGEHWAQSGYPYQNGEDFVTVKVPGLAVTDIAHARKAWSDAFDYEVLETRPNQGEFDLRIFEKNPGLVNENAIAGIKANRIRDYFQSWGCSGITLSATDISFTFSLWNAVRSSKFWDVDPVMMSMFSFFLNSYSGSTGIGNITVTTTGDDPPTQRITRQGGTVISAVHPDYTFEIERLNILSRFKADVKNRMQKTYMRHQYHVSVADVNAIIAAGGIMTITKAQFFNKLKDKMAV